MPPSVVMVIYIWFMSPQQESLCNKKKKEKRKKKWTFPHPTQCGRHVCPPELYRSEIWPMLIPFLKHSSDIHSITPVKRHLSERVKQHLALKWRRMSDAHFSVSAELNLGSDFEPTTSPTNHVLDPVVDNWLFLRFCFQVVPEPVLTGWPGEDGWKRWNEPRGPVPTIFTR